MNSDFVCENIYVDIPKAYQSSLIIIQLWFDINGRQF